MFRISKETKIVNFVCLFSEMQYISNEKTFLKKYLQLYFDSLRIFYGRNICICICICVWQVLLLKYIQHINKLPVGKFFKVVEIFFFQEYTVFPQSIADTNPCMNLQRWKIVFVKLVADFLNLTPIDWDSSFWH